MTDAECREVTLADAIECPYEPGKFCLMGVGDHCSWKADLVAAAQEADE